ncbi:unnamed protein product, partial [Effrenium voratum]
MLEFAKQRRGCWSFTVPDPVVSRSDLAVLRHAVARCSGFILNRRLMRIRILTNS